MLAFSGDNSIEPPLSPKSRAFAALSQRLENLGTESRAILISKIDALAQETLPSLASPAAVQARRGKPAKGKANKRIKSNFEAVEAKKCKNCGRFGHNPKNLPMLKTISMIVKFK